MMGMSKGVKERYHNDSDYRAKEQEKHNQYCRKRYHSPEHHEKEIKRCREFRAKNGCIVGRFHGLFKTRAWRAWDNMRNRVLCPSQTAYERYKDFTINSRWDKFVNFYEDMGDCPEGLTLDRIDNNEGYFKDNCRWATDAEQAQNRSNCVLNEKMVAVIREMGKQSRTKVSIARELGVKPDNVSSVLSGRSWKGVAEYV